MIGTGKAPARFGAPIIRLGETESTNDVGRLLAREGVPEGAVVVADRQTQGRGRLGRVWLSPEGGLWCSVLLRPGVESPAGSLGLAVGVAVAEGLEQVAGLPVSLKWPNDVVVRGRKVGGILLEATGRAVVAGIGVNLAPAPLPEDVARRAGALEELAGRSIARDLVLDMLLDGLARWYRAWCEGGAAVIAAWRRRDALAGQPLTVSLPDRVLEGTAAGIDDDGALRLRLANHEIHRILAGDVVPVSESTPG